MKKLTMMIAAILFTFTLTAQEKTLLGSDLSNGGYGGFFTKVGTINGSTGVFMGGQGAWIINHSFAIGGKGYALISPFDVPDRDNLKMEFGCWGGLFEYVFTSDRVVHLSVNTMIGAGGVRYSVKDYQYDHSPVDYSEDAVFVLEPGLDAEIKVHKNFRVGIGMYYRYVSGVEYADLASNALNGLSGQVTLKFGAF